MHLSNAMPFATDSSDDSKANIENKNSTQKRQFRQKLNTDPIGQYEGNYLIDENEGNITPKKKIRVYEDDDDQIDAFDKYKE